MKLDLSELTAGIKKEISFDYPLTIEDAFYGVAFPEPMRICGVVRNQAGYISVSADVTVTYDAFCDRCLSPLKPTLRVPFVRTLVKKGTLQDEDELSYIQIGNDDTVVLDDDIREEFVLSFPTKHLCADDCKGLCPICGMDLNVGRCSCREEDDPSPFAQALSILREDETENE